MKNPNPPNKNCAEQNLRCPISEAGADNLRTLAESFAKMTEAAARMEASESCPEFLSVRAWQRAESIGRVMDNLIEAWEKQGCAGLCFDCEWEKLRQSLAIIDALTPCNQWFMPGLSRQNSSDD